MSSGFYAKVVVFLGHETSVETSTAYRHLRTTAGRDFAVLWLLDVARGATPPGEFANEIHTYDSRDFAEWGMATFGPTMLPGHCHFTVLKFFRQNPRIRWLWVVEYDVRFTGRWSDFFGHFLANDADLLICHVRTFWQEPGWKWWNTLRNPEGEVPQDIQALRGFLVIARYSARALDALIEGQKAGWRGHQEVIVPTLLSRAGLSVCDINDGARRRFYTSITEPQGSLLVLGTLRYRPARSRAGFRSEMLYHPVKPAHAVHQRPLLRRLARRMLLLLRALLSWPGRNCGC